MARQSDAMVMERVTHSRVTQLSYGGEGVGRGGNVVLVGLAVAAFTTTVNNVSASSLRDGTGHHTEVPKYTTSHA